MNSTTKLDQGLEMKKSVRFSEFENWLQWALEIRKSKMLPMYDILLAFARSKKDIVRLNSLLPYNCQLPYKARIALEEAWLDMYDGNPPEKSHRPSDDKCVDLMSFHYQTHGLTSMYMSMLDEGRVRVDNCFWNVTKHEIVYSIPERHGYGWEHFCCYLFDHYFLIGVRISNDEQKIAIRIVTRHWELNEKITHQLLSLPPSAMCNRMYGSDTGYEVDFTYFADASELMVHIDKVNDERSFGDIQYVARDTFLTALLELLNRMDIPVRDLHPLTSRVNSDED